jgi:vanillate O-demethylase monooxygenase subunit
MFIPLDEGAPALRPAGSQISPNDWSVLARYWYPVAVAGDVKDAPLPGKLLDVDLVIYRSDGEVAVALDVCPHRHIRLTAGRIVEGKLVCSFHGLTFNAAGQCVRAPALGREAKLPPRYRLQKVRSEIRYGLVWVCLDDASPEPIPAFPAGDEVGPDRLAFSEVRDWPCSAARQVENFTDIAHIPFVHPKTLGGDPSEAVTPVHIEHTADALVMRTRYRVLAAEGEGTMLQTMVYTVRLPFMIDFETQNVEQPAPDLRMINFPVPISAYQSRVFCVFALDGPSPSQESGPSPGDAVNLEDIEVLKHLARPELPLDQKHEIHLSVDNNSIEYRKRLRALGLGRR